jgi:MFS family permease
MTRERLHFLFLNVGHFIDHLATLIFATVAALVLTKHWGMSYAELIPYATPGFVAFGVFALPAGWLADRWTREGMMAVFFIGIGLSSIGVSFATTPLEMAIWMFVVGMFAAIYHPVGLALLVDRAKGLGRTIAINGVWGNLGVGSAALITGFLIDALSWRAAFIVPGVISVLLGIAYTIIFRDEILNARHRQPGSAAKAGATPRLSGEERTALIRLTALIFAVAIVSSLCFQSMTFALPRIFEERLTGIAGTATMVGWMAFIVFAIASMAQLVDGSMLDRYGPRAALLLVASIQIVFFLMMPGLTDWAALLVSIGLMLGAFGQIPITDYMIGQTAKSELRASIYGTRFVVTFMVLAATIPFLSWVHANYGFDTLFRILAVSATVLFAIALLLPAKLPLAERAKAAA